MIIIIIIIIVIIKFIITYKNNSYNAYYDDVNC